MTDFEAVIVLLVLVPSAVWVALELAGWVDCLWNMVVTYYDDPDQEAEADYTWRGPQL